MSAACGDNGDSDIDPDPDPDPDPDVCLACASSAVCDTTAATPCGCVDGFGGDGLAAGTGCTDINECLANASNCDPVLGACVNTEGAFSCACVPGFIGDGTTTGTGCTDIDECIAGNDCEPVNGICTNTPGAFTCSCALGFAGDGVATGTGCADIDECASANDCDNLACTNTAGSFHCEGLYAIEPFQGVLARLDPVTFQMLDLIGLTSTGAVTGITAMARHPITGTVYVIAKVSGITGRAFGTLDLATGAITVIASVDRFSSLEFVPDGTLYALTGAGATVRKTLFTMDLVTGIPTLVGALGTGADGEVMCFDTDDAIMYHWTNGAIRMDSFPLATPLVVTTASAALPGVNEVFGCKYVGNHTFLVHDISSHVRLVTSTGVVSLVPDAIPTLFQDVRATLPNAMAIHTARPLSGPFTGGTTVTLRGIGLTGVTVVNFGGVAAASFTVIDDTTITAVTAAGPAATVNITAQSALPFVATWPAAFTLIDPNPLALPTATSRATPDLANARATAKRKATRPNAR